MSKDFEHTGALGDTLVPKKRPIHLVTHFTEEEKKVLDWLKKKYALSGYSLARYAIIHLAYKSGYKKDNK